MFNTYGIDAMSYWEALRHYVEHVRSEFCDPSFYSEFEWFAKRMGEHERRRSETPNSLVGSDADAVDKFLRIEIRRGP